MRNRIERIFPAVLCALSVALPYCLVGPIDIWVGNRSEFRFSIGDFAGWMALLMVGVWLVLTVVLMAVPDKLYPILLGLLGWIGVMSCVQGMFLNVGLNSLLGDDGGKLTTPTWFVVTDTVLWVAAGVGCVIGAMKMKKHEMARIVATILLVTVCGMQLVGCASLVPQILDSDSETETVDGASDTETAAETVDEASETVAPAGATEPAGVTAGGLEEDTETESVASEPVELYLTTAGLNTVAPGKNIIVFVLDRFDTNYYDEMIEADPAVFDALTGFTAYPDNISLYSRTYPAIASMITGQRNDFSGSAEDYFANAYGQSEFLKLLKDNDYAVRIYTDKYYGYRDAAVMDGIVNNLNASTGYTVTNTGRLVGNMLALSAYRYLPTVLKPLVTVSTTSFAGIGVYGDAPAYEINDRNVFDLMEDGLTLDASCGQNAYTFIHLNGCHVASSSAVAAARNCFEMIRTYIDELKRLGVYEDATIIITGDHPWAVDDYAEPTQTRLTALFVKETGRAEEPFRVSSAQVSQENNLLATLVSSAGLKTDRDWGVPYADVPEGMDVERHHLFEYSYENNTSAIMDFRVYGSGRNLANWEMVDKTDIGWLYK